MVYSWGVLHHTGAMWEAIGQAADLVKPGGTLVIAIYLKTRFCPFWRVEKRLFSSSPKWIQVLIAVIYSALFLVRIGIRGNNPIGYVLKYQQNRGMSWWTDQIDWLGGYPYESASAEEVTDFVVGKGFEVVKTKNTTPSIGLFGSGCGEYVFRRRA